MLQPARRKFRKEHKGRNTGIATRGAAGIGQAAAEVHLRGTPGRNLIRSTHEQDI